MHFWKSNDKTPAEVKNGFEWQTAFSELLEMVENWEAENGEEEIDVFHQKCLLLGKFLAENPPFSFREKVIRSYLKLLNNNSIQKQFVAEWFLQFENLLLAIREDKSEEKEKLLELVNGAKNQTIQIYAQLDRELEKNAVKTDDAAKNNSSGN